MRLLHNVNPDKKKPKQAATKVTLSF